MSLTTKAFSYQYIIKMMGLLYWHHYDSNLTLYSLKPHMIIDLS